jgi:hypothetical protein
VERTRFLKTQLFGDVADACPTFTQLLERHGTPYFVFDLLIGTPFTLEFSAEGAGAQMLFEGEGLQGRPITVMAAAQTLMHLGRQAMLVAEADHQPLRRGAQEHFERSQVLNHRQTQIVTGEFYFGALGAKGQIRSPKQSVIAQRQTLVAKVGTVDRDAPATEPAQQADHQHQVRFFAEAAGVFGGRMAVKADDRAFAAHGQGAAKVAQEQAEIDQALAHGLVQVGLLNQCPANQGERARWHAMGVEPEKLVVQFADLDQPQSRKRIGRHPRHGLPDHRRIDAGLLKHGPHPLRVVPIPWSIACTK